MNFTQHEHFSIFQFIAVQFGFSIRLSWSQHGQLATKNMELQFEFSAIIGALSNPASGARSVEIDADFLPFAAVVSLLAAYRFSRLFAGYGIGGDIICLASHSFDYNNRPYRRHFLNRK